MKPSHVSNTQRIPLVTLRNYLDSTLLIVTNKLSRVLVQAIVWIGTEKWGSMDAEIVEIEPKDLWPSARSGTWVTEGTDDEDIIFPYSWLCDERGGVEVCWREDVGWIAGAV